MWIAGGSMKFPKPIGIPKGELVELRLEVAEFARNILTNARGPGNMAIGGIGEGPTRVDIPARFSIQASIWGYREVQQRGDLAAS